VLFWHAAILSQLSCSVGIISSCSLWAFPLSVSLALSHLCCLCSSVSWTRNYARVLIATSVLKSSHQVGTVLVHMRWWHKQLLCCHEVLLKCGNAKFRVWIKCPLSSSHGSSCTGFKGPPLQNCTLARITLLAKLLSKFGLSNSQLKVATISTSVCFALPSISSYSHTMNMIDHLHALIPSSINTQRYRSNLTVTLNLAKMTLQMKP